MASEAAKKAFKKLDKSENKLSKEDQYKNKTSEKVRADTKLLEEKRAALKKVSMNDPSSPIGSGGKFGNIGQTTKINPEWARINSEIQALEKSTKGALSSEDYTKGLEEAKKEDIGSAKEGQVNALETAGEDTLTKLKTDAANAQAEIDRITNDPNIDPTSPKNKTLLDNLDFFVKQGEQQIQKNEELKKLYGPNYEKVIAEGKAEGLKRATGAKQQGIADASTLAAIGSRATAQQLGVGSPMTQGQMQTLAAGNQQMSANAFQQGQRGAQDIDLQTNQYVQGLNQQNLDYQKYFADKQMGTSQGYRDMGLAVGKDEAKNKYGLLAGNIREGRDINAGLDQFGLGLKSSIAGERLNQYNQKLGAFDTAAQQKLQETQIKNNYELGQQQMAQAKDEAETNKWLGIGNLILGGAKAYATGGAAAKTPIA